jgi:hypothetical protein
MKKIVENKTVWFYTEVVAAVLVLVAMVIGVTTKGLVKNTFSTGIVIAALIGIAIEVVYQFINWEVLPLLVTAMYALAFGMIANQGSYVISDHINGVNFLGGNYDMVLQCLALVGIALVLSILALFHDQKKA